MRSEECLRRVHKITGKPEAVHFVKVRAARAATRCRCGDGWAAAPSRVLAAHL